MEKAKVIAHFSTGQLIKGYTNDFSPKKPVFHVSSDPSELGAEVAVKDLKALFFVRDFEGTKSFRERKKSFDEGRLFQGKKMVVTFRDGEKMAGTVLRYDEDRPGFFLVPVDEEGNNTRVFIVSAAVNRIEFQ